jgi:Phage tail tube protein
MPLISGLAGQVGFKAETTWGVALTPVDRFIQFVEESMSNSIERLESDSIIQGARVRRSSQWTPSISMVEGDLGLEVFDGGQGLFWHHAMGSATWTGTNPCTMTFTPGDLQGKGLTMQYGRPSRSGVVVPFTYGGCKIGSWECAMNVGEIATLGLTFIGKQESTTYTLAAPTYNNNVRPLNFAFGALKVGNSDLCVRSVTIAGENSLADDRVCFGQRTIDEPMENDLREYTASFEVEFGANGSTNDLELYNNYINGLESTLDVTMRNSTSTCALRFIGNTRYDGATPNIGGKDLLTYELNGVLVGPSTDAGALTIVYTTTHDTAP